MWINKAIKTNVYKYWEHVLIFTDDIISIYHESHAILEVMSKVYDLKRDPETKKTYDEPMRYLGINFDEFDLPKVSGTA